MIKTSEECCNYKKIFDGSKFFLNSFLLKSNGLRLRPLALNKLTTNSLWKIILDDVSKIVKLLIANDCPELIGSQHENFE